MNNVTYSLSFFRLRFCKKIEWLLLCNESVEDFIVFRIVKRLCVGIPSERTNYCQQISRDIFLTDKDLKDSGPRARFTTAGSATLQDFLAFPNTQTASSLAFAQKFMYGEDGKNATQVSGLERTSATCKAATRMYCRRRREKLLATFFSFSLRIFKKKEYKKKVQNIIYCFLKTS